MHLVDFLITYLAIGAAFAMRVYFSNRHRQKLFVFRSVLFELAFWLPKWGIWLAGRLVASPAQKNPGPQQDGDVPWYGAVVDDLAHSLSSSTDQKRFREAADRYAALRTALRTGELENKPEGQFELFNISGHLNGRTGTSCLYRKNLAKLRDHSLRSAEDLVQLAIKAQRESPASSVRSKTMELFSAFDDADAIAMAKRFETSFVGNTIPLSGGKPSLAAETGR